MTVRLNVPTWVLPRISMQVVGLSLTITFILMVTPCTSTQRHTNKAPRQVEGSAYSYCAGFRCRILARPTALPVTVTCGWYACSLTSVRQPGILMLLTHTCRLPKFRKSPCLPSGISMVRALSPSSLSTRAAQHANHGGPVPASPVGALTAQKR